MVTRTKSLSSILAVAATLAFARDARAADPSTADCLTASEASLKAATEHQLRAERAALLVCAAASCPADIRRECARRVDEVNAQQPTLVFSAKDGMGADLVAVTITMDGDVVATRLDGTALTVDPGTHVFKFEAPGEPTVVKTLVVVEGQKDRREVVTLGETPPPGAPADSRSRNTLRGISIGALGLGVAGIAVGSVFGGLALSKKNDAQSACPGACPTQDGVNKWSDASTYGNVSTVGFIVGGVGLVGGAVLWLTTPKASTAPQVGVMPGGVQLRGAW